MYASKLYLCEICYYVPRMKHNLKQNTSQVCMFETSVHIVAVSATSYSHGTIGAAKCSISVQINKQTFETQETLLINMVFNEVLLY